jgi:hypothetical protein
MPMATAETSIEACRILVLFCLNYDLAAGNADDDGPQQR